MPSFRTRLAAAATAATIFIAACGESSPGVTASDVPSYDGGHTFGGGHRSDTTTATTTTAAPGEAAVNGGGTFGGGH
jgi:hypothetical protein